MSKDRALVLFDFDGTITRRDTLFSFTRFSVGDLRFLLGMSVLAVPLFLHKVKLLSAHQAKELFITFFFGGKKQETFQADCREFARKQLSKEIRPSALQAIADHLRNNSRVIIVSASAEDWILPWAETLGLEVLATRLEIANGQITGKIQGANCNGIEKVNRILNQLSPGQYSPIVAYGDSRGDGPMLEMANKKFYKFFKD